jgi:hypothetical protein
VNTILPPQFSHTTITQTHTSFHYLYIIHTFTFYYILHNFYLLYYYYTHSCILTHMMRYYYLLYLHTHPRINTYYTTTTSLLHTTPSHIHNSCNIYKPSHYFYLQHYTKSICNSHTDLALFLIYINIRTHTPPRAKNYKPTCTHQILHKVNTYYHQPPSSCASTPSQTPPYTTYRY